MAQDQPRWLQFVHKFERTIGVPVEAWVRSDAYFDLVTQAGRASGRWFRGLQELQREWLHMLNLPTNTDVTSVREQLARVERRLAEIGKEIADRDQDGNAPPPTTAE
jgi:hypothetical protein